jgi:hypothetical protein
MLAAAIGSLLKLGSNGFSLPTCKHAKSVVAVNRTVFDQFNGIGVEQLEEGFTEAKD